MDRKIGVWIDHKQAFVISESGDKVEVIASNLEPPAHYSGGTRLGGKFSQKADQELRHNDRINLQLTKYYRQVMTVLRDANLIFIMGPGKAKIEFEKVLKRYKSMQKRLVKVEPADKMTKNQMVAYVRKFYKNHVAA